MPGIIDGSMCPKRGVSQIGEPPKPVSDFGFNEAGEENFYFLIVVEAYL